MTKTTEESYDTYTAYLVPANINTSIQTNEFQDNFNQNEEVIFNDQTLNANYLTGKKILSKEIPSTKIQFNACIVNIQNTDLERSSDAATTITSLKNINKINLSEREGNEYVLLDEVSKFNEFIDLASTIHT